MGLDYTEMIIKIEDKFNLDEIDQRELYEVNTPGKLIDIIVEKRDSQSEYTCVNVKRFNILRKALVEEFEIERKSIRLESHFTEIIPILTPNKIWKRLESALFISSGWPSLLFPESIKSLKRIIRYSFLLYTVFLAVSMNNFMMIPIFGIGFVTIEIIYYLLQKKWGTHIDPKYKDVCSTLPLIEVPGDYKWSRTDIANELRQMIIDDFMVSPDKYSEDADFFKDIGLD